MSSFYAHYVASVIERSLSEYTSNYSIVTGNLLRARVPSKELSLPLLCVELMSTPALGSCYFLSYRNAEVLELVSIAAQ